MSENMKLSEAIQLGAMLRPQVYDSFGSPGPGDGTCALGAALEAVGKLAKTTVTNEKRIKKIWPWLNWRWWPHCPWCGLAGKFSDVFGFIVHLNDRDHLTRQQIANLIFQIEKRAIEQIQFVEPSRQPGELAQLEAKLPCHLKKAPRRKSSPVTSAR